MGSDASVHEPEPPAGLDPQGAHGTPRPRDIALIALGALLVVVGYLRVSINERNGQGLTPLQRAMRANNAPVAKLLLTLGADAEAKDAKGETPARVAIASGEEEMARTLLAHGADPKGAGAGGLTPLHAAAKVGNVDLKVAVGLAVGAIIGTFFIGAPLANAMHGDSLKKAFGIIMVIFGLQVAGVFDFITKR